MLHRHKRLYIDMATVKSEWEVKFIEKMRPFHQQRRLPMLAKRMLKKLDGVKGSMTTRSKKYGVECNVTLEELRQLAYDSYGTECKYLKRVLKIDNMVFDHRIPISKGGSSNIENIQVICKAANNIKGSLVESDLVILLNWLDTVSEDLREDIRIRLAGGKR
jgi:5-methylcytosine-specific restriction endonuclease McrA